MAEANKTLRHIRLINRAEDELKQGEMDTPLLADTKCEDDWCGWDISGCGPESGDHCLLDYA